MTFRQLGPLVLMMFTGCGGCQKADQRVVVYCAQDREFAEDIFRDFETTALLKVQPKFDTEKNKSVSLVEELEQEASRPRCDVHWNNEILGTIRLSRKGLYEPYRSPSAKDFPENTRGKPGDWQAFAERARVLLVNTQRVPPEKMPRSIWDLTAPAWKGQIAMAKPQFGTTATHAACLMEALGEETGRRFFRELKANEVQLVAGNKQVATGVREGRFAFGVTDTDDAIIELLAGHPVAIVYPDATGHPDHPKLGTLFIPNTVAILKGAPNLAGAKQLVDELLKPDTERRLATGGGYQLPVNPTLKGVLHPALKTRHEVKILETDFDKAADLWETTQKFLKDEFAR